MENFDLDVFCDYADSHSGLDMYDDIEFAFKPTKRDKLERKLDEDLLDAA